MSLPLANHANIAVAATENGSQQIQLSGDWTLPNIPHIDRLLLRLSVTEHSFSLRTGEIKRMDTAGAMMLNKLIGKLNLGVDDCAQSGLTEAQLALFKLVESAMRKRPIPQQRHAGFRQMLERLGLAMQRFWQQITLLLGFIGLVWVTLAGLFTGKRKWRLTATVFHMEHTGLDAVPIVSLLSFLIGAVVAFLGATVLADFGAAIFTVELVTFSFMREFSVLMTAIIIAGRSGSAFTAQIGSMKSREELDAIRALGLDAIELLVIPRLVALVIMLPVLTFIAMITGILGGALVGMLSLDITPGMFISRMQEMTELRHFWVGMIKAPVFAFLIAIVGCLEGMKVEGSAESVGQHTTASVVQSIFLVILFDALFAIFFMEIEF